MSKKEDAAAERAAEEARLLAEKEAEKARLLAEEGFARMVAPEDCTECSYDGSTFHVGADGLVYVPHEAVNVLVSHGFKLKESN